MGNREWPVLDTDIGKEDKNHAARLLSFDLNYCFIDI
jgi:hypothetical protein